MNLADDGLMKNQNIMLEDRAKLSISGVEQVDNFNETVITLETVRGGVTVKGEDLNISSLNLEEGKVMIDGLVSGISYSDKEGSAGKGGSFLGKMFK